MTGIGRLPMHSVAHEDRLPLDGRWRFQLLASPDDQPGPDWSEADVPSVWTMSGTWDRPHYTNVQMPFPGDPPDTPALNPTGVYERDIEVPDGVGGPADRPPRRSGRERPDRRASTAIEIGVGKDSHLASEFDLTACLRPGRHTLTLRVVKWSDASYVEDQDQWWHGGITRPVYLYATSDVYLADVRIDAGLADDLTTGMLDMTVTVGFPGSGLPSGWTVEAAIDGLGETSRPTSSEVDRTTLRAGHSTTRRSCTAPRRACRRPTGRGRMGRRSRRMAPPLDGLVTWHLDVPAVAAGRRSARSLSAPCRPA